MLKRLGLERPPKDYLTLSLVLSMVLHLLFIYSLKTTKSPHESTPQIIEVTIDPGKLFPMPQVKRQIVSEPSSREVESAPANAKLEAEKNRAVEKEQIKRGLNPEAGPDTNPRSSSQAASQSQMQQRQATRPQKPAPQEPQQPQQKTLQQQSGPRKLTQLKLDNETLLQKYAGDTFKQPQPQRQPQSDSLNLNVPTASRPFSRPRGSGAKFLGQAGVNDHLPDLPDGDLTLLNTKANQFAVFVRRVATKVFANIQATGWSTLSAHEIHAISQMTTVRAVLSPTGEILSVTMLSPSGSDDFDRTIMTAVKNGASDPHPPPNAARADGNIGFIFQSKIWSQMAPSGPGISERRWLLLATGLE